MRALDACRYYNEKPSWWPGRTANNFLAKIQKAPLSSAIPLQSTEQLHAQERFYPKSLRLQLDSSVLAPA